MSMADVEKAKKEAVGEAMVLIESIVFTVLVDKYNAADHIVDIWRDTEKLADEIIEGYVSVKDLVRVLQDEYGIFLRTEWSGK